METLTTIKHVVDMAIIDLGLRDAGELLLPPGESANDVHRHTLENIWEIIDESEKKRPQRVVAERPAP